MLYLKILVAEASYHGKDALTYRSSDPLAVGKIVNVPLRNRVVPGVVVASTPRPTFAVKSILGVPDLPLLPASLLELHRWMETYYPAPLGTITQHFIPHTIKQLPKSLDTHPQPTFKALPALTADQTKALQEIQNQGLHLLHGQTGSGKTRVYIELAKINLLRQKSSIVLTPEIGLTSQLAEQFRRALGDTIVKILHSKLSVGVRQKIWQEILQAKTPLIVIGPRSALFSPLGQVGLIVVDEAHETAYKQDKAPYYHASTVSAKLAQLHGASLVLGSATPLVTDYYVAKAKSRPIISMTQNAMQSASEKPTFTIVDKRDKGEFGRSANLSNSLIALTRHTLNRQEQVLLFLNRRGTARVILCEHCGWQALCPHCDLPLTYHGDTHRLLCHSCGYRTVIPINCLECSNATILLKSVGTKAIVDEIQRLFPNAKVQRFDTDNTKAERFESHYEAVRAGDVNILVGTQTLAKGLDLPKLGLVGVINAETSLSFPDFSATERTYQLLAQVLGRIGRGHRSTQAVIQSYSPDSWLLRAAIDKNWSFFYNKELLERKQFNFPPYCYLLKLTCKRATSNSAEKTASSLKSTLLQNVSGITVDGPAAAFHEKSRNQFVWQLVVKSRSRGKLLDVIEQLPANWSYDIDPMDLL